MIRRGVVCVLSALLAAAGPAAAQEVVLGLGYADHNGAGGEDGAAFQIEYHAAPFGALLGAQLMGAAALDLTAAGDAFAGIGLLARWSGSGPWFVDASVMPGLYAEGEDGNDLGGDVQFRSALALGRRIGPGQAVSLALGHKSNAGLEDRNPGMTDLTLRWHRAF